VYGGDRRSLESLLHHRASLASRANIPGRQMPEQRDLSGIVQPGRGLGAGLMTDRAVREKLEELIGFPVVPGTLNVRLPRPLRRGRSWRYLAADEIASDWEARTGQSGYFLAPVTVAGRYRGLAFQAVEARERGYPADQIELFGEAHLRTELGLSDGDPISVWLDDL
jgi:CTP-dependent riboflavin kinase